MKHSLLIKKIAVLAIMLLSLCGCSSDSETETFTPVDAPDFTLDTIDGKEITLSGLKGKVVLLDFWATWCGPCKQSVPELVRIQKKYGDKGLTVLGVSVDTAARTDDEQLKKFIRKFGINYPVMRDDGVASSAYFGDSEFGIPVMQVINRDGKIVKVINGFTPGVLEEIIEPLI